MIERIRELAAEMKPAMIDLAQRLIRTPSLSGQEKDVADLILAELEKLGYDEVFRDPWGSVCGIIHGTEPAPPSCTTAIWTMSTSVTRPNGTAMIPTAA